MTILTLVGRAVVEDAVNGAQIVPLLVQELQNADFHQGLVEVGRLVLDHLQGDHLLLLVAVAQKITLNQRFWFFFGSRI